jgi:hypothetical protein
VLGGLRLTDDASQLQEQGEQYLRGQQVRELTAVVRMLLPGFTSLG